MHRVKRKPGNPRAFFREMLASYGARGKWDAAHLRPLAEATTIPRRRYLPRPQE